MIRLLIHDGNRAGWIGPAGGPRHFDGTSSIVRSTPLDSAGRSSSTRVSNASGGALMGEAMYELPSCFATLNRTTPTPLANRSENALAASSPGPSRATIENEPS